MFVLKVMALASACGFGAFFGWYAARFFVEAIEQIVTGFVAGYRRSRNTAGNV